MSKPNHDTTSKSIDEILDEIYYVNEQADDLFNKDLALSVRKAKSALLTLIADRERKARIDTISDMIIECYDHDNPMEIARELEQERATLQAEDKGGQE